MLFYRISVVVVLVGASTLLALACGSSDSSTSSSSSGSVPDAGPRGIDPAGQACTAATQCYAGVDGGGIVGEITCLTKVTDGYWTHVCAQDTDCCATPGECLTGVKQVCSPLENQGAQYCFLSCEDEDIQRALAANADAGADAGADSYCQVFAGAATSCRSSGGGNKNRKVCLP